MVFEKWESDRSYLLVVVQERVSVVGAWRLMCDSRLRRGAEEVQAAAEKNHDLAVVVVRPCETMGANDSPTGVVVKPCGKEGANGGRVVVVGAKRPSKPVAIDF